MYAGHPPFEKAHQNDSYYKLLITNRADLFWKNHSRNKPENFFREEFKDLITNMLQYSPNMRLGLVDIIGHPWMSAGPIATDEQIQ
jgi:serine/threonine protein kinase